MVAFHSSCMSCDRSMEDNAPGPLSGDGDEASAESAPTSTLTRAVGVTGGGTSFDSSAHLTSSDSDEEAPRAAEPPKRYGPRVAEPPKQEASCAGSEHLPPVS